ncbi:hypothetical protein ACTFIY_001511 [Dictyostelium cf. discoideum]
MISNQNTINNIDNNKKCTLHPNKDIVFFCLDCKLIPCCIQCTSSKGEHHGHRTDPLESTSNILSLMNNFKDYTSKKIKKIHDIISIIELDIKKQLETTFENNTLINTIITSSINNDNQILSTIINNNNNKNENENENENENITTIEKLNEILKFNDEQIYDNGEDTIIDRDTIKIIKQYQQSLIVLNNNNNIHSSNKLNEYDNQIIYFYNQIIDDLKNNLKSIYTLNNIKSIYTSNNCGSKIEIDENNNKFFKWDNLKFYIYIDGDSFKFNVNEGIAFKDNCNILSKLKKNQLPSNVMLLDGFNQKLTPGILPDSVEWLYIGDIKQELIIGSIPNTVKKV